ncbi:hypothetical protein G4O51_09405 [Candidatus Bathyarchaeota archaeon A05DMB-2]|jgi:hypothetical protein|nr:hypothetical protein [Candidatus Bathyarchaeota archaeon A05DMB-2]
MTYGTYAGYAVIQTTDGGYAIAGYAATYGPHGYYNQSALLIKTDSVGEAQWEKTYSNELGYPVLSVMQTEDAGYILSTHGGHLLKLGADGNIQWAKTYGVSLSDSFAIKTSDGGYVLAGWMRNDFNGMDTFLVKTDQDGFVLWNKTFAPGGSSNALVYAVMETKDGGYALTGQWGNGYFWLATTDSEGNLLVNQTYNVSNLVSYSESFANTADGGYILAGGDGSNAWFVKTDTQGNMQWNRSYTGRTFVSVAQTVDGGYIAAESDKLVKTDASGEVQWDTGSLLSEKGVYSVIVTEDRGYAVTGCSGFNVWLAKFAPESTIPPNEISPPLLTTWIVIAVIIVAVAGIGLLVYFKTRKRYVRS